MNTPSMETVEVNLSPPFCTEWTAFDAEQLRAYLIAKAESYGLALATGRAAIEDVIEDLFPER